MIDQVLAPTLICLHKMKHISHALHHQNTQTKGMKKIAHIKATYVLDCIL